MTTASERLICSENRLQYYAKITSLHHAIGYLISERRSDDRNPQINEDLRFVDGMRVLCLLWVLMLGVCQFTMSSAVFNPWTLQHYFQTYGYTAVYSSNLGFDEFFFLSSLLLTVKMDSLIKRYPEMPLTLIRYAKLFGMRFLRLAPIYYLIFLIGWQVGPHFGSGPCWFTYEKGFSNCD